MLCNGIHKMFILKIYLIFIYIPGSDIEMISKSSNSITKHKLHWLKSCITLPKSAQFKSIKLNDKG